MFFVIWYMYYDKLIYIFLTKYSTFNLVIFRNIACADIGLFVDGFNLRCIPAYFLVGTIFEKKFSFCG